MRHIVGVLVNVKAGHANTSPCKRATLHAIASTRYDEQSERVTIDS